MTLFRLLPCLCLAACATTTPATRPTSTRALVTMGTRLQVEVRAATSATADRAATAAVEQILAADRRWSSWRPDSVLSALHTHPSGEPIRVDAAFRDGLRAAIGWSSATGGAFDPGIGRLVAAWRTTGASGPDLATARARSGAHHFTVTADAVLRRGDAHLAEGGFVKGLALDRAVQAAGEGSGVEEIWLDLGGQFAWWRSNPRPHRIAVAHPDHRDRSFGRLDLPPTGSLATSGNSERATDVRGRRHSHILDPRTGHPARDWGAVTVLVHGIDGPACAADCLSTALFVLGPVRGLALATRLPGVEALFLERTPRGVLVHRTPGIRFAPESR